MKKIDLSKFNGRYSVQSKLIWDILNENNVKYTDVRIDIIKSGFVRSRDFYNIKLSFYDDYISFDSKQSKDSDRNLLRLPDASWCVIRVKVHENNLYIDNCLCEIYVK